MAVATLCSRLKRFVWGTPTLPFLSQHLVSEPRTALAGLAGPLSAVLKFCFFPGLRGGTRVSGVGSLEIEALFGEEEGPMTLSLLCLKPSHAPILFLMAHNQPHHLPHLLSLHLPPASFSSAAQASSLFPEHSGLVPTSGLWCLLFPCLKHSSRPHPPPVYMALPSLLHAFVCLFISALHSQHRAQLRA